MKKTVYFRVGSDKAGTVSIADFVENNRAYLTELGCFAPVRNCIGFIDYLVHKNSLDKIDFFDATRFFKNNPEQHSLFKLFLDLPSSFFKNIDVFLTTETLWGRLSRSNVRDADVNAQITLLLDSIKSYFPEHNIKIILSLRRADLYIESLYGQHLKGGGVLPKEKFINRSLFNELPLNSLALLTTFNDVFGRDNVIIKPFERGQMFNHDLLDDLLMTLSIDCSEDRFIKKISNESLHRIIQELLLDLNQNNGKILSNKELLTISGFLKNELKLPDTKYILSESERRQILERFSPLYDYISKTYFNNGEVFHETLPSYPVDSYTFSNNDLKFVKKLLLDSVGKNISLDYLQSYKDKVYIAV